MRKTSRATNPRSPEFLDSRRGSVFAARKVVGTWFHLKPAPTLALLLGLLELLLPATANARDPYVAFPTSPEQLPAMRYAALSRAECVAEAKKRKLPFKPGPKIRTVDTPVRLTGPLRGVSFEFAYAKSKKSKADVLDCRLLLALDDLAGIAVEHSIVTLRYNSIYRRRGASRKGGVRHPAGVAMDVIEIVKKDGQLLNVEHDFESSGVGARTCGDGAKAAKSPKATTLREFICAVDRARLFNLLLTPHYDRHHKDHVHFEVRRGIRWFLTH